MIKISKKSFVAAALKPSLFVGLAATLLPIQTLQSNEVEGISDTRECRTIEAAARRLLCYDTVVDGGVFIKAQLLSAPQANFESVEGEQATTADFEKAEEKSAETTGRVGVTIVRVHRASNGTHFFYTDNGEVWKQSGRGNWTLNVPFEAEIKKGALSSYFLVSEGGRSTRIKRVRQP